MTNYEVAEARKKNKRRGKFIMGRSIAILRVHSIHKNLYIPGLIKSSALERMRRMKVSLLVKDIIKNMRNEPTAQL